MSKYPNAGEGLHKLYISMIGMLVCIVFNIVPVIGFLGSIGVIAFSVVYLVGCYQMAKDIIGCRIAFILQIVSIIIAILNLFDILGGIVGVIVNLINGLMPVIVMAFVCFSVSEIMRENDVTDVAKQGVRAWIVYLVCIIVGVLFESSFILIALQLIGIGGMFLVTVLTLIILLIGNIVILKFYKNAAEQFGVY